MESTRGTGGSDGARSDPGADNKAPVMSGIVVQCRSEAFASSLGRASRPRQNRERLMFNLLDIPRILVSGVAAKHTYCD